LGVNTLVESGTEASNLDFSGLIPEDILKIIGPAANPPMVSVPNSFNVARDAKSRLVLSGTPFVGDATTPMTVTLFATEGVFDANTADGVTVSGPDNARTFTGSVANLNKFFTNPNKVSYTFTGEAKTGEIQVTVMQSGQMAQALAGFNVVNAFTPEAGVNPEWTDLAVRGDVMVAVSAANSGQLGIYVSRDQGLSWAPAQSLAGDVKVQSTSPSAGLVGAADGTVNLFDGQGQTQFKIAGTQGAAPGLTFSLHTSQVLQGLNFTTGNETPERDPTR
jgi:hypothetical protein